MKFPLYNECPNCGHLKSDHSEYGYDCSAAPRLNGPKWKEYDTLRKRYEKACEHDKESIAAEITALINTMAPHCKCQLKPQDIDHAVMMQAAVEVALQRAGVGENVSHSRIDYPIIKNILGKGQIFGTSAHCLHDAKPSDLGHWVKMEDGEYVFCSENEAEGAWIGFTTINDVRCAIIDTSQRGRFSK